MTELWRYAPYVRGLQVSNLGGVRWDNGEPVDISNDDNGYPFINVDGKETDSFIVKTRYYFVSIHDKSENTLLS